MMKTNLRLQMKFLFLVLGVSLTVLSRHAAALILDELHALPPVDQAHFDLVVNASKPLPILLAGGGGCDAACRRRLRDELEHRLQQGQGGQNQQPAAPVNPANQPNAGGVGPNNFNQGNGQANQANQANQQGNQAGNPNAPAAQNNANNAGNNNAANNQNNAATPATPPGGQLHGALPPEQGLTQRADSPQVYLSPHQSLSEIHNNLPTITYNGPLIQQPGKAPYFDPTGSLGGNPVGARFQSGANSSVYESVSNRTQLVKKFIYLGNTNNPNLLNNKTMIDQQVGRAILRDVKANNPRIPFSLSEREGSLILVQATDSNNHSHAFALSRERNISSLLYVDRTVQVPNRVTGVLELVKAKEVVKETRNGQTLPAVVTDAEGRERKRRKNLTQREDLTINLAIRELNKNGIVWTDNKRANLDVVPDESSPTGHRVVFFDYDAFRPVLGHNRAARELVAREFQLAFDSTKFVRDAQGQILVSPNGRPRHDLRMRLDQARRALYGNNFANNNRNFMPFDETVFGRNNMGYMYTPGEFENRGYYHWIDSMNDNELRQHVSQMFNISL